MGLFKQKADAFLQAQQDAKTNPTATNRQRLDDARKALKATPEVKSASEGMAWKTSSRGSSPEWRQR
ncbi:hypothetical protein [Micromonospora sp. NPDC049891]|uniref:hypothetical protein n=1 Tax=Micromonospora sp. NPDC049891 TaxID=3155655 RepID=UPI0033C18B94